MKILIVDDSRTYQAVLTSYIADMGFEHISAMNGDEALEIFPREWPELILLDVNMPGMDGYEVARRIRDLGEEWACWVPIIFLSGNVKDEDIVMGIEAGGDDYLAKPISEIVLHAKIKAMLRMANHRLKAIEVAEALSKANEELESLSKTDGLTGIANKYYFNEYIQQEWSRCMRSCAPFSLLFVDIDHFKLYNDHYGHLEGDICLKKVAQALSLTTHRAADMAFRYGGEEFALILPDTDHNGMCYMGNRLVEAVRNLEVPHAHSPAADIVSVSVGGAMTIPHQQGINANELLHQADQAVYKAKEEGRNRFVTEVQD
ncbi:MAG: diguanylate cyclase [Mariprofundaceae bacterium]